MIPKILGFDAAWTANHIRFVPNKNSRHALVAMQKIAVPGRQRSVGIDRSEIEHDNGAICVRIIATVLVVILLFACNVPYLKGSDAKVLSLDQLQEGFLGWRLLTVWKHRRWTWTGWGEYSASRCPVRRRWTQLVYNQKSEVAAARRRCVLAFPVFESPSNTSLKASD